MYPRNPTKSQLIVLQNKEHEFLVLRLHPSFVVSRRRAVEPQAFHAVKRAYENKQALTGKIVKLHDTGVFVDLGGIDGYAFIGTPKEDTAKDVNQLFCEGQEVKVVVKRINERNRRISLVICQSSGSKMSKTRRRI
jgi:ribosomal protein S1